MSVGTLKSRCVRMSLGLFACVGVAFAGTGTMATSPSWDLASNGGATAISAASPVTVPNAAIDPTAFTVKAGVTFGADEDPSAFTLLDQVVGATGWRVEALRNGANTNGVRVTVDDVAYDALKALSGAAVGSSQTLTFSVRGGYTALYVNGTKVLNIAAVPTTNVADLHAGAAARSGWTERGSVTLDSLRVWQEGWYAAGETPDVAAGTISGNGWTMTGPTTPNTSLPNILLVGDSILNGYGSAFRSLASGHANVYTWNMAFFASPGAAGIPTNRVNAVSAVADFSWVVFNNGLHSYNWNEANVSDAAVAASYRALADTLAAANPHANLLYLATTPHTGDKVENVVSTYGEYNEVMKRLNRFAQAEMATAGIPYLDAYALLAPRLDLASGDHFHWTGDAYAKIARLVASVLGWYAPDAPATVEVDSAVSTTDYCFYRHQGSGSTGVFDSIKLHVGQGPGTPHAYYSSFFYAKFPGACSAQATMKLPVAGNQSLDANIDAWGLGYQTTPAQVSASANILADDDTTVYLNSRAPVKVVDDLVPALATRTGTLTSDVSDYVALLLNRAGTTNAWSVVRLNPDRVPVQTGTSHCYQFNDANTVPANPSRFTYLQYVDPFAAPLASLAGTHVVRGEGRWAQSVTAAGATMPLVTVCGRVGGADCNAVLRFPLPADAGLGVVDAALDLVVAPTGAAKMSVPAGIDVDVWALGIEEIGANADAAAFAVNPFLAGTTDSRALLNDAAPVRLGMLVAGGSVLVPGSTLVGSTELRTNLRAYLAERLGAGFHPGDGVRHLVLRLNATAPSAANAEDWGFGVGSVTTPGLASLLETTMNFTVTTLPEAVDGVVTIGTGIECRLAETNEIPNTVTGLVVKTGAVFEFAVSPGVATNFPIATVTVEADGSFICKPDAGASLDVASTIKGNGTFSKDGAGSVRLTRANTTGFTVANFRVEAGDLHLPEFGSGNEMELKKVHVAEGARLFMAGSDTVENMRTRVTRLSGAGLVTNAWRKSQVFQQDSGTTSPDFSGSFGGKIGSFWVYPSAKIVLTGTNSTFSGSGGLPGFGSIEAVKIGYDKDENSSIGRNTVINLGPNGGDKLSTFKFLGTQGETTKKLLQFQPWTGTGGKCALDAGLGGLVWNGDWEFGKCAMVWAVIQGDGAATNVMAGKFTLSSTGRSIYLEKLGSGTWFLKPSTSAHPGVTAVKEGRLIFETLRDKGVDCSLGRSTCTHDAYWGQVLDDAKAVPYAFLLGGGSKGEAVLECVGKQGSAAANSAGDRPLAIAGAGRLVASCTEPFALIGVSSVASSPVTLTLDGTCGDSTLGTVSNGTSAVSLAKEGSGTWKLTGAQTFSGALDVREGVLEVVSPDLPYSWYKLVIKTVNSYYAGQTDTCRVTHEFALYDADGVRQNVGLAMSRAGVADIGPGEATVVEENVRTYGNPTWAFDNTTFLLSNMFDENAGTSSYLAGRENGTAESTWISVVMRLTNGTPPIVACDLISNGGTWNSGMRRTVAYAVMGSTDGLAWTELTNQTTNETSRYTSGWYSDGTAFQKGAIRKLSEGHGIAIAPREVVGDDMTQLENVSSITVAEGATLRAVGDGVPLAKLNATAGVASGTVEGFTVAPNGEFRLSGASEEGALLPYTFVDMKGVENFRTWKLYENGVLSRRHLVVRANRLATVGANFFILLR